MSAAVDDSSNHNPPERQRTTTTRARTDMIGKPKAKKLKLRVGAKASPATKAVKPQTKEQTPEPAKRKKRRSSATYTVRVYGEGITKWSDKHRTRILESRDGLLFFEHRRPYSKKMATVVVPVERVLQFGSAGDTAWVHLKPSRILIDEFTAVEVTREGPLIIFTLSDDIRTQVNADADIEIVRRDD